MVWPICEGRPGWIFGWFERKKKREINTKTQNINSRNNNPTTIDFELAFNVRHITEPTLWI